MTSIDEVVSRSRQPGAFSERKRFTLARSRGIQKMRQFALADPHFYILELIQASVANGATYIDIQCDKDSMGLSYVGGGYHEHQLTQLFDFLFASREDVEHGDLRLLALGVNALMLFEPLEIVIESGNGTLKGTTRVVIKGREDVVDVGTPEQALNGTYIRASGMNRRKVAGRSSLGNSEYGPPECRAIEERCITAPVPILVNNHPLFGYSSQRTPSSLFGMRRTQVFDEGELYGAIGIAARPSGASFRLVTHGVWIQSVTYDLLPGIGGVVSFDRLRKTADHAGIVQDGRYEEMWLRLRPYAFQLQSGGEESGQVEIGLLDGPRLEPHEVIALIRDAGGGVFVAPVTRTGTYTRDHALAIGQALALPVVYVPEGQEGTLMAVAGSGALTIRPNFNDPEEVLFYQQPVAEPPPRPWLLEPMDLGDIEVEELSRWLVSESQIRGRGWSGAKRTNASVSPQEAVEKSLPAGTSAAVTIYTPADTEGHEQELRVEIRTASRVVWSGWLETAYPGHVLTIEVPNTTPAALRAPLIIGGEESLAELVAQAVVRHASNYFERASRRSLREFIHREIVPGSVASRMILAALARQSIKRVRTGEDGRAQVVLSSIDRSVDARHWEFPILETHSGRPISLRSLSEMLESTMGFVYGTVSEVEADLEGLDLDLILRLDLHTERMLIALLGEAAYIRVDGRDVLADYDGACCRDIALGLRAYEDFPLLVEGARPVLWSREEQSKCIMALVKGLFATLTRPGFDPYVSEDRRQALRHLRWLAVWQQRYPSLGGSPDLAHYPLFTCADGPLCSLAQILSIASKGGRVRMLDGKSAELTQHEGSRLRAFFKEALQAPRVELESVDLAMNPYVFHLLSTLTRVQGGADFELYEAEKTVLGETEGLVFIETASIDDAGFEGMLGLPLVSPESPSILVVHPKRTQVYLLEEVARAYGIVGVVRLHRDNIAPEQVEVTLRESAQQLLHDLATGFAANHVRMKPEVYERAVECLYDYAARNMTMTLEPGGSVAVDVWQGLAQFIFDLPIFPGRAGVPISAQRLIREFQLDAAILLKQGGIPKRWRSESLAEEIPEVLRKWIEVTLDPMRIHGLAEGAQRGGETSVPPAEPVDGSAYEQLSHTLTHWMNELRPDIADMDEKGRAWHRIAVRVEPDVLGEQIFASMGRNEQGRNYISVNATHWLVQWNVVESSERGLSWLLLAVYAFINERLVPVTNTHELLFQKRVAKALEHGELRMVGV